MSKRKARADNKPLRRGPKPERARAERAADQRPCTECGRRLWQHEQCVLCGRFVWCTDDTFANGRHGVCPS